VLACLEAAQASQDRFFADVAQDTVEYVLRQMADEAGGFYSAEDADSVPPEDVSVPDAHKSEGAFYLWRADEIDALLGPDAEIVKLRFGIEPHGNAPSDPQQEFTGKNLLYIARPVEEIAEKIGRSQDEVTAVLNSARMRMFEARLKRPRPHLDDKVLTAWNGLMIAALARTARVLPAFAPESEGAGARFLQTAERAAAFVRERMWEPASETLLRRYRGGHAEIEAYAEDYAYLVFGLLELFQAGGDPAWLEWAAALQRRQDALFQDEDGGWFSTTGRDRTVLIRMKEDYDGAEPSANSVSMLNLLVLSHLIESRAWTDQIDRTLRFFGPRLEQVGRAVPMMAAALSMSVAGVQQIVLVGGDDDRRQLARAVAGRYLPFAIVIDVAPDRQDRLAAIVPLIGSMKAPPGAPAAAFVCRNFTCEAPATTADQLQGQLS
jgi:uncharacterized protein YyaL (SSP411 family)